MGVEANAYFGGETNFVGNYWHKIIVDYREGKMSILAFLEKYPENYKKHKDLWDIIVALWTYMGTPNNSAEYTEKTAVLCEQFGEIFPINFPESSLSRKIHSLSYVFPKFIRTQNICHKMLKLEQAGERLHSQLNAIEQRFYNVKNKALQFWYILLEYENMLNCNLEYFKVKKKKNQTQLTKD